MITLKTHHESCLSESNENRLVSLGKKDLEVWVLVTYEYMGHETIFALFFKSDWHLKKKMNRI